MKQISVARAHTTEPRYKVMVGDKWIGPLVSKDDAECVATFLTLCDIDERKEIASE